jgi:hypothetical protein
MQKASAGRVFRESLKRLAKIVLSRRPSEWCDVRVNAVEGLSIGIDDFREAFAIALLNA